MNVLVVGSGGRENAIVWKLTQSEKIDKIFCSPGNAGIAEIAICSDVSANDISGLIRLVKEEKIDFTIVGSEEQLEKGIVDEFNKEGFKVFGPTKEAAKLETSKSFSKELMKKYGIPTARYEIFDDYENAIKYIDATYQDKNTQIVVKADGLATGKGVLICKGAEEAKKAAKEMLTDKKFGTSGDKIIIEEFLDGEEVSVLAFCDGKTVKPMVSAKDHKRAFENDEGLNTGGMGTIAKMPAFTKELSEICQETIFDATVTALLSENINYVGIIFFGLIITGDGVKVIEYNARFGDPETQVVLPLLNCDLLDILLACIDGKLDEMEIKWHDKSAACIVCASGGYPEKYEVGYKIDGIKEAEESKDTIVFHMGTKKVNNNIVTNGGRVICVTGIGDTLELALKTAYNGVGKLSFDGMFFRKDIGR